MKKNTLANLVKLKKIMETRNYSREDVARLTFSELRTVNSWFFDAGCTSHRNIPDVKIKLLEEMKL